jgi:DNA polymerase-3 subunit epsilon
MEPKGSGFFRRFIQSPFVNLLSIAASNGDEKQAQALIRSLVRETKKQEQWEVPLLATRYVVVDTETTGFSPHTDSLIAIGAVEMQGRTLTGHSYSTLVRPERGTQIPPHITDLTGITPEQAAAAPRIRDVLPPFLQFAKNAVLIMHHAGHDVPFLNKALRKTFSTALPHRVLDTCVVARWLHPEQATLTLEALLARYNLPIHNRHTALGDAEMTARLWQAMLDQILAMGIRTYGDLFETIILSN